VSPYAYDLELPASIQIHQVQPVSHLDPVVEDHLVRRGFGLSASVEVAREEEYEVSRVEDSWEYRNQLQY